MLGTMSISMRPSQALRLWQQVTLSQVRDDAPDLTMRQTAILLHDLSRSAAAHGARPRRQA